MVSQLRHQVGILNDTAFAFSRCPFRCVSQCKLTVYHGKNVSKYSKNPFPQVSDCCTIADLWKWERTWNRRQNQHQAVCVMLILTSYPVSFSLSVHHLYRSHFSPAWLTHSKICYVLARHHLNLYWELEFRYRLSFDDKRLRNSNSHFDLK